MASALRDIAMLAESARSKSSKKKKSSSSNKGGSSSTSVLPSKGASGVLSPSKQPNSGAKGSEVERVPSKVVRSEEKGNEALIGQEDLDATGLNLEAHDLNLDSDTSLPPAKLRDIALGGSLKKKLTRDEGTPADKSSKGKSSEKERVAVGSTPQGEAEDAGLAKKRLIGEKSISNLPEKRRGSGGKDEPPLKRARGRSDGGGKKKLTREEKGKSVTSEIPRSEIHFIRSAENSSRELKVGPDHTPPGPDATFDVSDSDDEQRIVYFKKPSDAKWKGLDGERVSLGPEFDEEQHDPVLWDLWSGLQFGRDHESLWAQSSYRIFSDLRKLLIGDLPCRLESLMRRAWTYRVAKDKYKRLYLSAVESPSKELEEMKANTEALRAELEEKVRRAGVLEEERDVVKKELELERKKIRVVESERVKLESALKDKKNELSLLVMQISRQN